MLLRKFLLLIAIFVVAVSAQAEDQLIGVSSRPGVKTSYWWMPRHGAITVLLMSGGSGGIGLRDGVPQSLNNLDHSTVCP